MRLVQYLEEALRRRVGMVEGDRLIPIQGFDSVYRLALNAIDTDQTLHEVVERNLSKDSEPYSDDILFLPAFDHPQEPRKTIIRSGFVLVAKIRDQGKTRALYELFPAPAPSAA